MGACDRKEDNMKNIYRALTAIGAVVLAVTAVPNARACGEFNPVLNRSMSPATHFALPSTQSMPATLDANGNPTIVGMWYVVWTSEGNSGIPDGTVTDFGITGIPIRRSFTTPADGRRRQRTSAWVPGSKRRPVRML